MNKEFIPYELAVKLKALGFDEECLSYYFNKQLSFGSKTSYGEVVEAPLFQQAFRWFREKYNLHFPIAVSDGFWFFERWRIGVYKTYEEAELACLTKLIEIVETKR